jgi:hypothetical protein
MSCRALRPADSPGPVQLQQRPYGPKQNHPATYDEDPPFAALKHLNARAGGQPFRLEDFAGRGGRLVEVEVEVAGEEPSISGCREEECLDAASGSPMTGGGEARQPRRHSSSGRRQRLSPEIVSRLFPLAQAAAAAATITTTTTTTTAPGMTPPGAEAAPARREGPSEPSEQRRPAASEPAGPPSGSGAREKLLHAFCSSLAARGAVDVKV